MSKHQVFSRVKASQVNIVHPIVLRFQGLQPGQLPRLVAHYLRSGGDLRHISPEETENNRVLIGSPDWAETLLKRIDDAKLSNFYNRSAAFEARNRKKELRKWHEGLRLENPERPEAKNDLARLDPPWHGSCKEPLREGLLTVNKDWFGGTGALHWDAGKVQLFEAAALAFMFEHFDEGEVLYVEAHWDEEAYHIHFILASWVEKETASRGQQLLLQPSSNPLIRRYELAQDLAGLHFGEIGLCRGERRAEQRREAIARGEDPGPKRYHIPPSKYRETERRKGDLEAQKLIEEAKQVAVQIGTASLKSVRRQAGKMSRKERAARVRMAKERQVEERLLEGLRHETGERRREAGNLQAEIKGLQSAAQETARDLQHAQTEVSQAQGGLQRLKAEREMIETEVRDLALNLRRLRFELFNFDAGNNATGVKALTMLQKIQLMATDGPFEEERSWLAQARDELQQIEAQLPRIKREQAERWLAIGAADAKTDEQRKMIFERLKRTTIEFGAHSAKWLQSFAPEIDVQPFFAASRHEERMISLMALFEAGPKDFDDARWSMEFDQCMHAMAQVISDAERTMKGKRDKDLQRLKDRVGVVRCLELGIEALGDGRLQLRPKRLGGPVIEPSELVCQKRQIEPFELMKTIQPAERWLEPLASKMRDVVDATLVQASVEVQEIKKVHSKELAFVKAERLEVQKSAARLLELGHYDPKDKLELKKLAGQPEDDGPGL